MGEKSAYSLMYKSVTNIAFEWKNKKNNRLGIVEAKNNWEDYKINRLSGIKSKSNILMK